MYIERKYHYYYYSGLKIYRDVSDEHVRALDFSILVESIEHEVDLLLDRLVLLPRPQVFFFRRLALGAENLENEFKTRPIQLQGQAIA